MKRCAVLSILLLSVLCMTLRGDVFSLWPSKSVKPGQGSAQNNPAAGENIPPAQGFWNEKIIVNGQSMTLTIHLIETTLPEIAKNLKDIDKTKCTVAANSNSIIMEEKLTDGRRLRTYYLHLAGVAPVLQFQMTLPKDHLNCTPGDWPKDLPLFDGAESLTAMVFPVRNAAYGAFTLKNVTKAQVLSNLNDKIIGMGWNPVSREADNVFRGTGEVYMRENPQQLLILGLTESAEPGVVRVSIYSRKITTK